MEDIILNLDSIVTRVSGKYMGFYVNQTTAYLGVKFQIKQLISYIFQVDSIT